ncbi:iron-containing alcohol dehydrogenase [Dendrothele bispora CBS 962.96]|uniref:Iron-containing alcohol dehydrogenase n=1 Tax=Dendrothele bispora (strain CBS 962.96) TaxID=1314807 RepID=A0A4S8MQ70_DENBC|nr:iron-containing alcohol dehydrogenase [Dendrothele bispora CBS 962.96]
MRPFVYNALPGRVVFGNGTLSKLPEEVKRIGCSKALVLTTPQQTKEGENARALLGDLAVGVSNSATMHTPVDVTEKAVELATKLGADCLVAIGGGSTTGLAKAIALRTDLPQIVVPTTYAGSETTPIIGQTESGYKTTQKSLKVLPEVIIYDVSLTLTLPPKLVVTSGINAIAHAVEALYSQDSNPMIDNLAEQGISKIARSLPTIVSSPDDLEARSDALFGAWACGTCLGAVGMALHHKLCHTLGGSFDLPHSETHTVVLPHAMAYNAPYASEAMNTIARALGVDKAGKSAALGIFELIQSLGGPLSLKELGMREEDLDRAADIAAGSPYPNPAPLEREKLRKLLGDAWAGKRPE